MGLLVIPAVFAEAGWPAPLRGWIETHCADCHDDEEKKGGLDLLSARFNPEDPANFALWVNVLDRVASGEMPPKKRPRPAASELAAFLASLSAPLTRADEQRIASEGRATQRRLNRHEYENALRDLLHAPWLQVKEMLPEDGELHRSNKVGAALEMSYINLQYYLAAAEYALRQVMVVAPSATVTRFHARDEPSFTALMQATRVNAAPERATFPVLGTDAQPAVRRGERPLTVGAGDPAVRELEGVGLLARPQENAEPTFNQFRAPVGGLYRLRLNAFSVWVGPDKNPERWWQPDPDRVETGRRDEPVMIYAKSGVRPLRVVGKLDVTPRPAVHALDVWLQAGETLQPDAVRLFRAYERAGRFQNPLAEKTGQPGVVYRWLEVEGPLCGPAPPPGQQLLWGDLPVRKNGDRWEIQTTDPVGDAGRLLRNFVARVYRRPTGPEEWARFLPVVEAARAQGSTFADAMIEGYAAVLVSPEFIALRETPGVLDDYALSSRLSFFLWNSVPDDELRRVATAGELHRPNVLRAQVERMLASPKSARFVGAFLDYWLDLRKLDVDPPDRALYPEYFSDELLTDSAREETRRFFAELVERDLPARNIVSADFAIINERLAAHYRVPDVHGVALRAVALPEDSPRGGLLTQASVLKVTANGTTTSPVRRGAWVMERILGLPPPPRPRDVPVIEPDTRGATTIREQLEKHRAAPACAGCHAKIDPAGYALESFDVLGGWRDRYRALQEENTSDVLGRDGVRARFHAAQPVDSTGVLPDGRVFANVQELKRLLLSDEPQIARNLARQLTLFATGTPIGFSDREKIERILARSAAGGYGVRTLIHEIVQSDLFRRK